MLNCSASLAMSTNVLKALPGKLDSKRHSPSILYLLTMGSFIKLMNVSVDNIVKEKCPHGDFTMVNHDF